MKYQSRSIRTPAQEVEEIKLCCEVLCMEILNKQNDHPVSQDEKHHQVAPVKEHHKKRVMATDSH